MRRNLFYHEFTLKASFKSKFNPHEKTGTRCMNCWDIIKTFLSNAPQRSSLEILCNIFAVFKAWKFGNLIFADWFFICNLTHFSCCEVTHMNDEVHQCTIKSYPWDSRNVDVKYARYILKTQSNNSKNTNRHVNEIIRYDDHGLKILFKDFHLFNILKSLPEIHSNNL